MNNTMDVFFSFGADPATETDNEVTVAVVQPRRSMFYNRRYGGGAREYENAASSFAMQIAMKFSIVSAVALYNQRTTNGSGGFPDRRVAVSQATIDIAQGQNGETDVTVLYIPMSDMQNPRRIGVTAGGAS